MQLEDEELGLGDATSDPEQPLASTSRSPSPSPSATSEQRASDLAKDLAGFKVTSTNPVDAQEQENEEDEEEELSQQGKKKKGGKRRKAQPTFEALPTDDEAPEDDFAHLGMAKKGRKGKGKGRSGAATPLEVDEPTTEPVAAVEEEEALPASGGKKSRRAKGKGKASGTATPLSVGEEDDASLATPKLAEGDGEEGTKSTKTDARAAVVEGIDESEMSKKDRRRLKEAARKAGAAGDDELVRLQTFSRVYSLVR